MPLDAAPDPLPGRVLRLASGLEVALVPVAGAPLVTVWVRYHVGARDDPPTRPGLAHLVEHLMFTGSRHTPRSDHGDHLYAARALDGNGATSWGATDLFQTVPAVNLERLLWLESDRMGFLRGALTREELETTRQVVDSELRIDRNDADARMFLDLVADVFPAPHPYAEAGDAAGLAGVALAEVDAFLARHHVPANATLVLAGDLPARAEAWVRRYFDDLPGGARPPVTVVPDAPLRAEIRRTRPSPYALPVVKLAWPTPPLRAPGDAEADVAATLLAHDPGGRLYVEGAPIARLLAHQDSRDGVSLFTIHATGAPGTRAADVLAAVDAAIAGLATATSAEVEDATRRLRVELLAARRTPLGLAEQVQHHLRRDGRIDAVADELRRRAAVTPASLRALVDAALATGRRAVILADPEDP